MPDSVQAAFQGTAAAFQSSTQNMGVLLLIAMIVVYIILGILYESFIHPLTILSGLPSAAVGALLTLFIVGHAADALCLCRHDHADRHREEERDHDDRLRAAPAACRRECSPEQAIYEAAMIRFRPIMMTTMAAMMGTLPIALRHRRGRGIAPAAGPVRGGRPAAVAAADALHHAGDLYLSRPAGHALLHLRHPESVACARARRIAHATRIGSKILQIKPVRGRNRSNGPASSRPTK